MEIVPIFDYGNDENKPHCIYAVKFHGEVYDEFEKLFIFWNDPEMIRDFLKNNEEDHNDPFWQNKSISSATMDVLTEAADFESDLRDLEDRIADDAPHDIIFEIFKPYHKSEIIDPIIYKGKAKGIPRPYLRIYGLFLPDLNQILIFGGGIKLTEKVNKEESPHLYDQVLKAQQVKDFLKANGIQFLE